MKIKRLYLFFLFGVLMVSAQENIIEVGLLPDVVSESSGLIFYNGKLITHNDSGNEAQLHEIDTLSLAITRTVSITNATNLDWEDITQDEDYIYIGDFGNFNGDRQDLVIYRILKTAYNSSNTVTADRIEFSYVDQTVFNSNPNSDWDAEALFILDNQLIILTKQWQQNATIAYALPKIPGNYVAESVGNYNSRGLITGATYDVVTETLFLVGYTALLQGFLIKANGLIETSIFGGMVERTNLNLNMLQVEAIASIGNGRYFFSSEFFFNSSFNITSTSRLFAFNNFPEIVIPIDEDGDSLSIFTPIDSEELEYELRISSEILGRAIFDSSGKMVQFTSPNEIQGNNVDIATLHTGIYYLTFYFSEGIISKGFVKR